MACKLLFRNKLYAIRNERMGAQSRTYMDSRRLFSLLLQVFSHLFEQRDGLIRLADLYAQDFGHL
jgi:hypothetical protein